MRAFLTFVILVFLVSAINVDAVFDYDATKQKSGVLTILEGEDASITEDGVTEVVFKVYKIGDKRVSASIDGRDLTLDLGESEEYDLDNDGVNDVIITLSNIIDNLARFKVQILLIPSPADVEEEVEEEEKEGVLTDLDEEETDEEEVEEVAKEEVTEEEVSEETKEVEEAKEEEEGTGITGAVVGLGGETGKWIIGGIIVVIIIVIIAFVVKGGDNPGRSYERARDLHREGQEFHYDGDDETAGELYEKANELRERARKMEGGI